MFASYLGPVKPAGDSELVWRPLPSPPSTNVSVPTLAVVSPSSLATDVLANGTALVLVASSSSSGDLVCGEQGLGLNVWD